MPYLNIELIGVALPCLGFLIASLFIFKKTLEMREERTVIKPNLFFATGFLIQGISYLFWVFRLILYSPSGNAFPGEYAIIYNLYILVYVSAGIGLPFLTFFGLTVLKGNDFLDDHKIIYVIPYVIVAILYLSVTFLINFQPFYYGLNNTLDFQSNLGDPINLSISFFVMILLLFPDSIFIYFLIITGYKSHKFKHVLTVTIGMLVYTIFLLIDGGKFFPHIIFYVRIGLFVGIFILIYGLYGMYFSKVKEA